ncbi:HEPN family nuclease [Algoriphagus sp. D3-2-R+10]|uniref:HEPN family nuclease n=1 Tax=Algoriphagus aurantiacus TaxID=3103948 RepID=UPI002B3E283B|nr:HEPN family nuclease [Algoriphagus sp. D3-2-R+10]MEB2777281.1 HEPN family nuclease [Algoriphagus sp. D3-2-R+10]
MTLSQEDNLLLQAHFTTVLLVELKNNNFFESDYYDQMKFGDPFIKNSLKQIQVDNQGALLMTLYAMLVMPKQLLENQFPAEFDNLNKFIDLIKLKASSTYESDSKSIDFVRHIRNAVAHARVTFKPNVSVNFLDKNESGSRVCEIVVPLSGMGYLLEQFQNIFRRYVGHLQAIDRNDLNP